MSLSSQLKNLKVGFPNLEQLTLVIDGDSVADEEVKIIIELVSKPEVDESIDLKVIFNFTMREMKYEDASLCQLPYMLSINIILVKIL